ncbi:MAG TPA: SGNH/GDSL hydrolase family protein [Streptosporangiaceae bacterium]
MPNAIRRPSRRVIGVVVTGFLAPTLLCSCKGTQYGPGATGAITAQAARTVSDGSYVALGDSYTAAPLASDEAGPPAGCLRSDEDYPELVARALRPRSFTNVSCFGASTYEMSHSQQTLGQTNPPQFSALSSADTLVTVQVGGDDVGFSRIVTTCGLLSLTRPWGAPCMDHYTAGGTDALARLIASTAPKIVAMLTEIRRRSPNARILLVGYPDILPLSGNGCWPRVPVARGDVPYLRTVETGLNAMLAASAAKVGVNYVDTYRDTIGHDACQPRGVKWVEGLIPTSAAMPMHPNQSGEQAMTRTILAALR